MPLSSRTKFRFFFCVLLLLIPAAIAGATRAQNPQQALVPNPQRISPQRISLLQPALRDSPPEPHLACKLCFRVDQDGDQALDQNREQAPGQPRGEDALDWQQPVSDWQQAVSDSQQSGSPQSDSQQSTPNDAQTRTGPTALDRRDEIFYPGDTERLKPLARKLALNILLDEKEFFTSPFHMNRDNAKWWLGATLVTAVLIAEDRRIANSLANSHGQVAWGGRVSQLGAPYTIVPVIAGYYGFGVLVDHAKAREIGVLGTESVMDSLILVEVLKLATLRNRPDARTHPGDFWAGGDSFPSGHTIATWSLASLVVHEYKNRPLIAVIAYGLAATVGASRIAARQHFASDIFVGGTMGYFIGRFVYNTHMSHLAHKHASLMPMIVPQYRVATRTYGVALLFGGRSSPEAQ